MHFLLIQIYATIYIDEADMNTNKIDVSKATGSTSALTN